MSRIELHPERGEIVVGVDAVPGRAAPDGALEVAGELVRPLTLAERDQLVHLAGSDVARCTQLVVEAAAPNSTLDRLEDRLATEAIALHLAGASMHGPLSRSALLAYRAVGADAGALPAIEADRLALALAPGLDAHPEHDGWTTIAYDDAVPPADAPPGAPSPSSARDRLAAVRDELAAALLARASEPLPDDLVARLLVHDDRDHLAPSTFDRDGRKIASTGPVAVVPGAGPTTAATPDVEARGRSASTGLVADAAAADGTNGVAETTGSPADRWLAGTDRTADRPAAVRSETEPLSVTSGVGRAAEGDRWSLAGRDGDRRAARTGTSLSPAARPASPEPTQPSPGGELTAGAPGLHGRDASEQVALDAHPGRWAVAATPTQPPAPRAAIAPTAGADPFVTALRRIGDGGGTEPDQLAQALHRAADARGVPR